MTGIIDMHAHILPGIDDGSRDWDESRRMLEGSYSPGESRYIVQRPLFQGRLPSGIYELAERLKEEAHNIAPDFAKQVWGRRPIIMRLGGPSQEERPLPWRAANMCWWNFDQCLKKMYQAIRN